MHHLGVVAASVFCACSALGQDLQPTMWISFPWQWQPGQPVLVNATVMNIDSFFVTNATQSAIYFSQDSTITTSDTLLAAFPTPQLQRYQSSYFTDRVTIPTWAPRGPCWIGVLADYVNQVKETNENNNSMAIPGEIASGNPDLRCKSLDVSATLQAGQRMSINATVENNSPTDCPPSTALVLMSPYQSLALSDTLLGRVNLPGLSPHQTTVLSTTLPVPFCTPARGYWVGVYLDAAQVIHEDDETNNTSALARSVAAYVGTERLLEFLPVWGSPSTEVTRADFVLGNPLLRSATMCVVAPQLRNHWSLLYWSARPHPNPVHDAFTNLGLALLNGPVMPSWLHLLDASGRSSAPLPALHLPGLNGLSPLTIYTHQVLFTPAFQLAGAGTNSLEQSIRP